MEMLRAELEVKNQMLSEVKGHLKEAAVRERQLQALSQDTQVWNQGLVAGGIGNGNGTVCPVPRLYCLLTLHRCYLRWNLLEPFCHRP